LSNLTALFKDETRMHPRSMKVQQNGCNLQAPCHHPITTAAKTVKTRSISFVVHSCSTNYVALSMIIITSHCLSTHT